MSLVDRLDGVHMGDMLHLVSEFFWTGGSGEGHVVGYVVNYTSEEVTLSHQGPVTPENIRHHVEKNKWPKGYKLWAGNRTYSLDDFSRYEVLNTQKDAMQPKPPTQETPVLKTS